MTEAWVGFHDVETRLGDLGGDGDGEGVDVGRLAMQPATDLDVLERFVWPLQARSLVRRGIAVTGVEALSR